MKKLKNLDRIESGRFVLFTLNMASRHKKQIKKHIRLLDRDIQLILDENDEISTPGSARCQAVLSCFRRCRMKLLTTGTSTRNNIAEFAPQLELL